MIDPTIATDRMINTEEDREIDMKIEIEDTDHNPTTEIGIIDHSPMTETGITDPIPTNEMARTLALHHEIDRTKKKVTK
jgi:hypothetical protein